MKRLLILALLLGACASPTGPTGTPQTRTYPPTPPIDSVVTPPAPTAWPLSGTWLTSGRMCQDSTVPFTMTLKLNDSVPGITVTGTALVSGRLLDVWTNIPSDGMRTDSHIALILQMRITANHVLPFAFDGTVSSDSSTITGQLEYAAYTNTSQQYYNNYCSVALATLAYTIPVVFRRQS